MKREYGLESVERDARSVLTVGTFDGVHRGHQALLGYVVERARELGGPGVVVSFDPHPKEVVRGEAVPLLTTVEERAELFEALGVSRFVLLPFTPALAATPAERFVSELLVARVGMQEVVVGHDHAFGSNREGNREMLERLGRQLGFRVQGVPAQLEARTVVSSTEVRRLLAADGEVRQAATMLGRPYALDGVVEVGNRRGRAIGFPTANLRPVHPRKIVPAEGVYAVRARLPDGRVQGGMTNIGRRPTFEAQGGRTIETHLFDFEGDLYGRTIRLCFVDRVRAERRFDGVEALVEQLRTDERHCRERLEFVP